MLHLSRRRVLVAPVLVLALWPVSPMPTAHAQVPFVPEPIPKAVCDRGSQPETGLQGEVPIDDQISGRSRLGYTCNARLVGHNDIDDTGMNLSSAMTWYGDCAYLTTAANTAIAVVDASKPRNPRLARMMPVPVGRTHEAMHASAKRGLLVVPGGNVIPTEVGTAKIAVYDVSKDCTRPKLLTVYDSLLPGPGVHAGQLSADGRTYYAAFAWTTPCMAVFDLDDPRHPAIIGTYGDTYMCHDLNVSRDGRRAYLGSYGTIAEALVAVNPLPTDNLGVSNPTGPKGLEIVDTSDVQARRRNPTITRIATIASGRPHSQTLVHIGRRRYVFATNEGSCASGVARVIDVTNEHRPVIASELALEYSVSPKCIAEWPAYPVLQYWSHMLGFDNEDDTAGGHEPDHVRLAFITSFGSGLRVINVTDPRRPREVAYFNPAVPAWSPQTHDQALTWVRYRPETGHIWFGSALNGLNIIELTKQARK